MRPSPLSGFRPDELRRSGPTTWLTSSVRFSRPSGVGKSALSASACYQQASRSPLDARMTVLTTVMPDPGPLSDARPSPSDLANLVPLTTPFLFACVL